MRPACTLLLVLVSLHLHLHAQAPVGEVVQKDVSSTAPLFATPVAYEQFVASVERNGAEWVLSTRPQLKNFELKLLNLRGEQITAMSDISGCAFLLKSPNAEPELVLWVLRQGWWTDFGVDFSRVKVETFDRSRWKKVLVSYMNAASGTEAATADAIPLYERVAGEGTARSRWNMHRMASPKLEDSGFEPIIHLPDNLHHMVLHRVVSFRDLREVNSRYFSFATPTLDDPSMVSNYEFPLLKADNYRVYALDNFRAVYNDRNFNLYFDETHDMVSFRAKIFADISKALMEY